MVNDLLSHRLRKVNRVKAAGGSSRGTKGTGEHVTGVTGSVRSCGAGGESGGVIPVRVSESLPASILPTVKVSQSETHPEENPESPGCTELSSPSFGTKARVGTRRKAEASLVSVATVSARTRRLLLHFKGVQSEEIMSQSHRRSVCRHRPLTSSR